MRSISRFGYGRGDVGPRADAGPRAAGRRAGRRPPDTGDTGARIPARRLTTRQAALFIAAALAVLILLAGCGASGEAAAGADGDAADGRGAAESSSGSGSRGGAGAAGDRPVPTAIAEVETRSRSVEVGGRLRPRTRITHEVPVSGIVRSVSVAAGQRVSAGTVLFTVERNEVGQTFRPTPVTARIDGVVSEVLVQLEEQVGSGDAAAVLVGRDGYELEAHVSDKDAGGIRPGQAVTALTADGATITGRLAVRAAEPDYETGLFGVTFRFPVAEGFGIGTFLLVDLPTERIEGIFVPRDAVDRRYGRYFVWAIDETEGVLVRREVSLGEVIGDEVRVDEGLRAGERYLERPTGRERDGAPAPAAPDGS